MTVYYVMLGIIVFLSLLCHKDSHSKLFLFLSFFIMLFIAVVRGVDVGTDTFDYMYNFEHVKTSSQERWFTGIQRGWYYINLLLNQIANYTVFLMVCYSAILYSIFTYIKKESQNVFISVILYFFLLYLLSYNCMRQMIAVGIVSLGYTHLTNNKKKYIIYISLASLIHFSAIVGFLGLIINKFYINKKVIVISIVLITFIIGLYVQQFVKSFFYLFSFLDNIDEGAIGYLDRYGGERNFFSNFIINIIFVFNYIIVKVRNRLDLKLYFLYIIIWNLFGASNQANRIVWYFEIGIITVVPYIFHNIKNTFISYSYLLIMLGYAFAIWYITVSSTNDLIPYTFR